MRLLHSFVFIAAIVAGPISAFNLDSLLVASVGGIDAYDCLKHLTSLRAEGAVNLNGQEGTFIEYFVPPDRFYLEVFFEAFSVAQVYDGELA